MGDRSRPNVVFIVGDNVGWGDFGCYGGLAPTPRIDQGFDEWMGIKNTSDESAYSTYPLFAESGFPVPKIWEGVKGSPVKAVADFNLETRGRLDEQIAVRTVDFIKRSAAGSTPFFTYVCFTQMHPPLIIKPQWPLVFDLIDDPVEEWDLIEKRLDCAWVIWPVAKLLGGLAQSAARYPHIKPGAEFDGYK